MPPISKKLTGHIGFGLSIGLFETCMPYLMNRACYGFEVPYIWIPHEKIVEQFFFLRRVISLSGVMSL